MKPRLPRIVRAWLIYRRKLNEALNRMAGKVSADAELQLWADAWDEAALATIASVRL